MTRTCDYCSEHFEGRNRKAPSCCSDRCRALRNFYRTPEEHRAANAVYKQRERARCTERERLRKAQVCPGHPQFVERVDRDAVYVMHGGCCGICREFVAADEFEVDHRVPLSRGGAHGYVNVQPAHPDCNRRKYNRIEGVSTC